MINAIKSESQLHISITIFNNYSIEAGLMASDIKCLGISTQRATFINWRRSNGKPFHNFITWKDLRADDLVKEWNSSFTMRVSMFLKCF